MAKVPRSEIWVFQIRPKWDVTQITNPTTAAKASTTRMIAVIFCLRSIHLRSLALLMSLRVYSMQTACATRAMSDVGAK